MKTIMLAAIISIATSFAFAGEPKVGDYALYDFTANGIQGTTKSELTAFNRATNQFTKVTTTSFSGQTQTQAEEMNADDLSSTESLELVLALCESSNIGGVLEQISTAAGTFETCRLPAAGGGAVNLGVVPFGFVRVNTADLTMDLVEYNFAK